MKRAVGLAGPLVGLAAWTAIALGIASAIALATANAEPHAHAPGADSHGAAPVDPSAPSTSTAPLPLFDAPDPGSYELPAIDRVGPHDLLGISGLPERLIEIGPGELALVSFVYLSCDEACPLSTALLLQLDRALAGDPALAKRIELVTVSFDSARDTPQAMAELHDRMAPRGRWRFLTAKNEASLRPVLADFGQDAVWIPGGKNVPDALRHVLKVYLVDAGGAVRQIYSTGFLDVRLVLADLRTLLPTAP